MGVAIAASSFRFLLQSNMLACIDTFVAVIIVFDHRINIPAINSFFTCISPFFLVKVLCHYVLIVILTPRFSLHNIDDFSSKSYSCNCDGKHSIGDVVEDFYNSKVKLAPV
jgi:hypothetical protein